MCRAAAPAAPPPFTSTQATVRAWGFQGTRLDPQALAAALKTMLTDLPFLAGRWALLHCVLCDSHAILHNVQRGCPLC